MEIKNAIIAGMDIEIDDRSSVLVAKITFDTGSKEKDYRQIVVGLSNGFSDEKDLAGYWLCRLLIVVGARSIQNVIGKAVRLETGQHQIRIGHIIHDEWFDPYELIKDSSAVAENKMSGKTAKENKHG